MDAAEGGENRFGFTIHTPMGVVTAILHLIFRLILLPIK